MDDQDGYQTRSRYYAYKHCDQVWLGSGKNFRVREQTTLGDDCTPNNIDSRVKIIAYVGFFESGAKNWQKVN